MLISIGLDAIISGLLKAIAYILAKDYFDKHAEKHLLNLLKWRIRKMPFKDRVQFYHGFLGDADAIDSKAERLYFIIKHLVTFNIFHYHNHSSTPPPSSGLKGDKE